MGIELKSPPTPVANYIPVQQTGNLIYLSGQGPRDESGNFITGKVGSEISADEACSSHPLRNKPHRRTRSGKLSHSD